MSFRWAYNAAQAPGRLSCAVQQQAPGSASGPVRFPHGAGGWLRKRPAADDACTGADGDREPDPE